MRARFASTTAARSASPASSRSPRTRPTAARRCRRSIAGRDVTLRGDDDAPDRYGRQPAFVFLDRLRDVGAERSCWRKARRWFRPMWPTRTAPRNSAGRRGRGAAGQTGNLGRSRGHKKRGKSGRYFGRDRAVYGGRGQGFVGAAGRGNDLSEFRPELDTGLCCDYFKAHDAGVRGGRNCALSPSKIERIRVRGWVEARGGPRIEVLRVGQIEVLGGN